MLKLSRASLLLGAFSQHMFGAALTGVRMSGWRRPVLTPKTAPAGSKPAGARGMHHAEFSMPFRPMAHGKLGKKYPPSASKRAQRERQRQYARTTNLAAFHSGNYDNVPASLGR